MVTTPDHRPPSRSSGFSLLEILLALAILGIIASLAAGAYSIFAQRAYREQAKAQLMAYAQELEMVYSQNRSYQDAEPSLSDSAFYTFYWESLESGSGFALYAQPLAQSFQEGSGALRLDHLGNRWHFQSDLPTGDYEPW